MGLIIAKLLLNYIKEDEMKKLITRYLLTIVILPAFLTGCYTQVATQDDSYSSDKSYDEFVYEGEESVE